MNCRCHGVYLINCPSRIPKTGGIGKASSNIVPRKKKPVPINPEIVDPNLTDLQKIIQQIPQRPKTALQKKLEETDTVIQFLRYPDGTLQLFKRGDIIGNIPAGYSEENVVIKVRVTRPHEDFVVVLPVTRKMLDQPEAEEMLAQHAYHWKFDDE